jgi:hypothetical protein
MARRKPGAGLWAMDGPALRWRLRSRVSLCDNMPHYGRPIDT